MADRFFRGRQTQHTPHHAWLLGLAWCTASACFTADLTGHACPCVDGFVCVDEVCREETTLGLTSDGVCPDDTALTSDCQTPPDQDAWQLIGVCTQADTWPRDVEEQLRTIAVCFDGEVALTLVAQDVSGTLVLDDESSSDSVRSFTLSVSGTLTWHARVPASCTIDDTCAEVDGCSPDGAGGCTCTNIVTTLADDSVEFLRDAGFGSEGEYESCRVGDTLALRADHGLGFGPTLLWTPR